MNAPTWTTGVSDDALIFNGTTQYVDIPDANSLDIGTADFSIAAWIKLGNVTNGTYTIYSKGIGETASRGKVRLYVNTSDQIALQIEGTAGAETATYTSTTTIDDTLWHHVAVAADRDGNASFVIDGGSAESVSISGSSAYDTSSTDDARIATNWDASADWFNGTTDEVLVYTRALSVSELQALYDEIAGAQVAATPNLTKMRIR